MTIVALIGAALIGAAIGAAIEARRPELVPDDPSLLVDLHHARRDADHWHDEYHRCRNALIAADNGVAAWRLRALAWERAAKRWHTTARQHETVLAALGRTVAEGGTLEEAPDA